MKTIPPAIVRIWMPALLVTGAYLFFHDQSPAYWLIPLPLVLALVFMTTLAEIEDCGKAVRIKYWWGSMDVDKGRIAEIRPFFLDDIGVVKLHNFALPWGCIYFVRQWSDGNTLLGEVTNMKSELPRRRE